MNLFGRLFRRQPEDPADQLIEWLSDKNLDDRRIVVGILYGGPYSLKVCKWVLSRPDCDKGTASMLLWNFGRPDILTKGIPGRPALQGELDRELVEFICDRWKQGLFANAIFAWDTREYSKLYRRELKKKGLQGQDPFGIPEDAWEAIIGRSPEGTPATALSLANPLSDILGALRLADLAAINPQEFEPLRRRSLGLD